jgi:hypothetical protein
VGSHFHRLQTTQQSRWVFMVFLPSLKDTVRSRSNLLNHKRKRTSSSVTLSIFYVFKRLELSVHQEAALLFHSLSLCKPGFRWLALEFFRQIKASKGIGPINRNQKPLFWGKTGPIFPFLDLKGHWLVRLLAQCS